MEPEFAMIGIAVIIVALGIIALPMIKKRWKGIRQTGKYPEGHFMGLGIALGIPMGIPISIALDNFAFMGAGIAIGVAIGAAMEANARKQGKIRKLNAEEIKQRNLLVGVGMGILLLGIAVFLGIMFFK